MLAVLQVACETTQTFVHSDRRPVVTGIDLLDRERRVTLVAERLPWVGADLHGARALVHHWQAETADGDGRKLPPIEQGE